MSTKLFDCKLAILPSSLDCMAATQLFVFYFAVTRFVLLLQKTTSCYYSRVVSSSLALPRVQLQFDGEAIQGDAHCLINEMP